MAAIPKELKQPVVIYGLSILLALLAMNFVGSYLTGGITLFAKILVMAMAASFGFITVNSIFTAKRLTREVAVALVVTLILILLAVGFEPLLAQIGLQGLSVLAP